MARHTPGPWSVEKTRAGKRLIVRGELIVAQAFAVDRGRESDANARAIAAAPVLLQACQAGLAVLAGHPADLGWRQDAADLVRVAVTRARGEESGAES